MFLRRPDYGPKQARTFVELEFGKRFKRRDPTLPTLQVIYEITKEPYLKSDNTMWAEARQHEPNKTPFNTIFSLADNGVTAYTNGAWSNNWLEKVE